MRETFTSGAVGGLVWQHLILPGKRASTLPQTHSLESCLYCRGFRERGPVQLSCGFHSLDTLDFDSHNLQTNGLGIFDCRSNRCAEGTGLAIGVEGHSIAVSRYGQVGCITMA